MIKINIIISKLHERYKDITTYYDEHSQGYFLTVKFSKLFKEDYCFSFNVLHIEMYDEKYVIEKLKTIIDNDLKCVFYKLLYK